MSIGMERNYVKLRGVIRCDGDKWQEVCGECDWRNEVEGTCRGVRCECSLEQGGESEGMFSVESNEKYGEKGGVWGERRSKEGNEKYGEKGEVRWVMRVKRVMRSKE